jgi:flagellar basal body-associated protein FliL
VSIPQILFTVLLIVVLLALAGYYGWRQGQLLRRLRTADDLSAEDRRYFHRQAWRRLAGSVLMVVLAGLLFGSFFLEGRSQELADRTQAAHERHEEPDLSADDLFFRNLWVMHWIILLIGVMAILGLAAYDFWATRRYGLRHYRQLQADRRAMIAHEIATLRRERNGQHS